ncbi:MAG TPA: universal stress protein [Armatimonadota bacterium]|nr:universal stress protein [Armatimonadota bacterium]
MREFARLLVGVDFSPRSQTAAEMAVALARKAHASVDLVYVIETIPTEMDAWILGLDRLSIEQVEAAEAQAAIAGLAEQLDYERIHTEVVFGKPDATLTQRYDEKDIDLLLIGNAGSHSPMPRHGLGSTAYKLVEHGPERVLVVKAGYHGALDRIAAAIDFSGISDEVVRLGTLIAGITGARLSAVHAFSTALVDSIRFACGDKAASKAMECLRQDRENRLGDSIQAYQGCGAPIEPVVLTGSVSSALMTYLRDEEIDLAVVGTETTPRIAGYPIGSTTHAIVNETPTSVLVVRAHEQTISRE